jgi:hypothetical protein
MMLAAGIVMASCSNADDVFEQNQANLIENQKNEYKANYVAKFGQPDANQSWDFTNNVSAAKTRAGETMTCQVTSNPKFFYEHIFTDAEQIKRKIASAEVKTWNPYLSVWLVPSVVHTTDKALKFGLSVCYNDQITNIAEGIKAVENVWGYNLDALADAVTATVFSLGRRVDTRNLTTAQNVYWAAYSYNYEWKWRVFWGEWKETGMSQFKLETYKEIKVNGRTYWCFDCTNDGDYSNLVCLAIDPTAASAEPQPISKRYMVEDLGSKDDFDFNDIVFDVIQETNGSQKCIVRAMGGTLDFTLQIGDTEWTKSVDGVAKGYNVKTMYNTQGTIEWDKVLAEFPVTGWDADNNNISVKVKTLVSDNVIIEIPFPKKGEVPMIIAFPAVTDWQAERVSLPESWWVVPEEITDEE